MRRRWPVAMVALIGWGMGGCALPSTRTQSPDPLEESPPPTSGASSPAGRGTVDRDLLAASYLPPLPPPLAIRTGPSIDAMDPPQTPPELLGPRPVDPFIRRALCENRMVQAARFNVLAMKARIPQVTALDDPTASNTIYPIPAVGPQYSLMGYNPYNLMLSQQFPWFGTLRLRGEAAELDVQVALAELAAAQLDAVANVKRAYFDLHYYQKAESILIDNRKLAGDFVTIARSRYAAGNSTQQDVLRAEVAVADLDRELIRIRQGLVEARAELAQQLHISPESELQTLPELPLATIPAEVDRLYHLAAAARPEIKGRLASIARDEVAVALARKRYYPNYSVGLSYMDMEKTNAQTPKTAGGFPNVGLFVGFNLPVYRGKYRAGVCEAQARASADARLYEAERDSTNRDVKAALTQANSGRAVVDLFRSTILPRAHQALEAATGDYTNGNVDYVTLITAWREVLQIELQLAQVEAELRKTLATLERAVGLQINEHPPSPSTVKNESASPPPA